MVRIGTTFNYTYADSKPKWKVKSKRGASTWQCEVVGGEWQGAKKVFGSEEIENARRVDAIWKAIDRESKDWWASRKIGETLHYHNAFGQYIRGTVINQQGKNMLLPLALVGSWAAHDLPSRGRDGEVRLSYTVRKIRAGEAWQPNEGSVFESPSFSRPMGPNNSFDPRRANPLDISDPEPLTGDAAVEARYEHLRMRLTGILGDGHRDPKAALTEAARMIAELGIGA
jgi:hypothetical protein